MAASLTGAREPSVSSKWLNDVLFDFERKVSAVTAKLEGGGGDKDDEREYEIVRSRKYEVVGLLDEMMRSYACLAHDHDHLMTELARLRNLLGEKQGSNDSDPDPDTRSDLSPVSGVEDPEPDNLDISLPCKPIDETGSFQGCESSIGEIEEEGWRWDDMKVQMAELLGESERQQEELARRNEEKREIIRVLQIEVKQLMAENKVLQDCLVCPRVGLVEVPRRGNRTSSLKELVWNKLFRRVNA